MSFTITGSASLEFEMHLENSMPSPMQKMALLKRVGIEGENELKDIARTVRATGELENSPEHELNGIDGVSVFTRKGYGQIALKDGRAPGKAPPIAAIELWRRRKGIAIPAFLIARKIAKLGTNRFMQNGPDLIQKGFENFQRKVDLIVSDFVNNGRV